MNVTVNIETISVFSFDGHQIGKPRFAKIRSVDCYREASFIFKVIECPIPHLL